MQDYAQEAAMDRQSIVVVVNKAELPELIHEMADPRPGCADHLGQVILTDFRQHRFGPAFLAEMSEQQEDPRETLFARIKKLVHKIRFESDIA